jgi:hypothetical protein
MTEKGFPECQHEIKQILSGLQLYKTHIAMDMPKANITTVHITISQTYLRFCKDLDAER